jgi:hypothetical protein
MMVSRMAVVYLTKSPEFILADGYPENSGTTVWMTPVRRYRGSGAHEWHLLKGGCLRKPAIGHRSARKKQNINVRASYLPCGSVALYGH